MLPAKLFYNILWGVHYMHICTQINNGNNDPIKVFIWHLYAMMKWKKKLKMKKKMTKCTESELIGTEKLSLSFSLGNLLFVI